MSNAQLHYLPQGAPWYRVYTDSDGYFSSDVQAGNVTVKALTNTESGEGYECGIDIEYLSIEPGEVIEVNFVWNPGKIKGRVTNADGTGMPNTLIRVTPQGGPWYRLRLGLSFVRW